VFVVSDIAKSVEHYRDALGFTVTFQYGQPIFYACLCRDEVSLHLLAAHETKRLARNGGICIFVNDVDSVHAELCHARRKSDQATPELRLWHARL
jgi:catechol 2,3-dioxygenase-like lactoylglutathione lyase family enzyme